MKLVIISNVSGYSWAGSESVWHNAAMLALKMGYKVTAAVHHDLISSDQIKSFLQQGGDVWNWKNLQIARFQKIKEKFIPSFPVKQLDQFDVILVSLGSLPAMTYVPGLVDGLIRTTTPIVLLCQFNSDHLIISPRERRIVAKVMEKSFATVFVSERNRIEARRQFAMEPPNAKVILNSAHNKPELSYTWPENSQPISFASVARLEVAWKGQDLLLDVLSQAQWSERNWHLNLYGEGADREYLERLAAFYKLSDRVSFKGHEKKIDEIWARNHILVMPSHGEGTPLAALEAMMAGRPVIATDVGGNAEIIKDNETGFIAAAATLGSFSKTMERAWEARDQWKEMGEKVHQEMMKISKDDPAEEVLKLCKLATERK